MCHFLTRLSYSSSTNTRLKQTGAFGLLELCLRLSISGRLACHAKWCEMLQSALVFTSVHLFLAFILSQIWERIWFIGCQMTSIDFYCWSNCPRPSPQPCRSLSVAWLSPASGAVAWGRQKIVLQTQCVVPCPFQTAKTKWKHRNNWKPWFMDGLWCKWSIREHKGSSLGWDKTDTAGFSFASSSLPYKSESPRLASGMSQCWHPLGSWQGSHLSPGRSSLLECSLP